MRNSLPAIFALLNFFPASAQTVQYGLHVPSDNKENFKVTMTLPPGSLGKDSIYHFVAYAPGVHQKMDFGRFVKKFSAYDKSGKTIPVVRTDVNGWKITRPDKLQKLEYETGNTFDMPADENPVHPQAGSGIGKNYCVLNPHAVFGYFKSLSKLPVRLHVEHPRAWKTGTSLMTGKDGDFSAGSYKDLLDAPFLLGKLSTAKMNVSGIDVEVFVYSPGDSITAEQVLQESRPVLTSAARFIGYAPVPRYALLVFLYPPKEAEQMPSLNYWGALEHGYSSMYVMPAEKELLPYLKDMIAHEFLHILSPLHLHSDKLAAGGYAKPAVEDDHLWLYEGLTEWATHIMQLKSGDKTLQEYFDALSAMIRRSRRFEAPYNLVKLSREWNTPEGEKQYGNIYQLGALTAAILDIRLLQLSGGERGLREAYLELIKKYGKDKPFDNDVFFEEFIAVTHPDIRPFIENHIKAYTPFDYNREFEPLGISYAPAVSAPNSGPSLGFTTEQSGNRYEVQKVLSPDNRKVPVKVGDEILSARLGNHPQTDVQTFLRNVSSAKVNETYRLTVVRNGEKTEIEGTIVPEAKYDAFEIMQNASPAQLRLREKWMRNR